MLHLASTGVLFLIAAGLWFRKRKPRIHLRLMIAALISDVLLVLYIEISRHAVEKVATQAHPLLWFHAGVSVADHCMLSVPTVISGEDYSMSALDPSEGVTIHLSFDGEPIAISLITRS